MSRESEAWAAQIEQPAFDLSSSCPYGIWYESKSSHQRTAEFSHVLHSVGFHVGHLFLTHTHMTTMMRCEAGAQLLQPDFSYPEAPDSFRALSYSQVLRPMEGSGLPLNTPGPLGNKNCLTTLGCYWLGSLDFRLLVEPFGFSVLKPHKVQHVWIFRLFLFGKSRGFPLKPQNKLRTIQAFSTKVPNSYINCLHFRLQPTPNAIVFFSWVNSPRFDTGPKVPGFKTISEDNRSTATQTIHDASKG